MVWDLLTNAAFMAGFVLGAAVCWIALGVRLHEWKRKRLLDDRSAFERQMALRHEWDGEPVGLRRVTIEVADNVEPDYWARSLVGRRHPAVEVRLDNSKVLYLDDASGVGWQQLNGFRGFFSYLSAVPGSVQPRTISRRPLTAGRRANDEATGLEEMMRSQNEAIWDWNQAHTGLWHNEIVRGIVFLAGLVFVMTWLVSSFLVAVVVTLGQMLLLGLFFALVGLIGGD